MGFEAYLIYVKNCTYIYINIVYKINTIALFQSASLSSIVIVKNHSKITQSQRIVFSSEFNTILGVLHSFLCCYYTSSSPFSAFIWSLWQTFPLLSFLISLSLRSFSSLFFSYILYIHTRVYVCIFFFFLPFAHWKTRDFFSTRPFVWSAPFAEKFSLVFPARHNRTELVEAACRFSVSATF